MSEMIKPRECRRCGGTGYVDSRVNQGRCFACGGAGKIETDKSAIAAHKARSEARKALGQACLAHSDAAHWGLSALERDEPARLVKALDSWAAGRADVLNALAAYGKR